MHQADTRKPDQYCYRYCLNRYLAALMHNLLRRPVIPESCVHNGHIYYILLTPGIQRSKILAACKEAGIGVLTHYEPLHLSPAGQKLGRTCGSLNVTEDVAGRLLRLPMWMGYRLPNKNRSLTSSREQSVVGDTLTELFDSFSDQAERQICSTDGFDRNLFSMYRQEAPLSYS